MRRLFAPMLLLAAAFALTGCVPKNQPLPTGAVNAQDAQINAVLQAGHAAVAQYDADVASGFVPVAAYKAVMADLTKALNVADPLYQAYHQALQANAAAPEPAALATAVSSVQSSLSQIPTAATGGK